MCYCTLNIAECCHPSKNRDTIHEAINREIRVQSGDCLYP